LLKIVRLSNSTNVLRCLKSNIAFLQKQKVHKSLKIWMSVTKSVAFTINRKKEEPHEDVAGAVDDKNKSFDITTRTSDVS